MPAAITKIASRQTYYTIRFLVAHTRVQDAYRAYAYFRWVDDQLDANTGTPNEKLVFLNRQKTILDTCYRGEAYLSATPEEQMLVDLITSDHEKLSGLQFYLRNMMAVMAFDVHRKGRSITRAELDHYSRMLSMAVSEALFYFICHEDSLPCTAARYRAVFGAHISHMLRDTLEDIDLGYINIPQETLQSGHIVPGDLDDQAFKDWVIQRTEQARHCFKVGKGYIARIKNFRFRLAALTYLARFEWMLKVIEREGYHLRRSYPERKSLKAAAWMAGQVILSIIKMPFQGGMLTQAANHERYNH